MGFNAAFLFEEIVLGRGEVNGHRSVVLLSFGFALRLGLHKLSGARVTRLHELAEHLEERLLLIVGRYGGSNCVLTRPSGAWWNFLAK